MPVVARIIDANANRAREALRVMEDAARFALDDAALTARLKNLRHDLAEALGELPAGWLEASRDVVGDVGTSIGTAAESRRGGVSDLAVAAGKRLSEALRSIEEAGKVVSEPLARRVEALRYRSYELESALLGRLGSGRARQWAVCVLLTDSQCRRPWRDVAEAVIEAGADCIQLREKEMTDRALLDRAKAVVELARPAGVAVIVNDRVDVALLSGADGVHLGQDDLAVEQARRLAGRSLLIGMSTHDEAEARAAVQAGADYCGVGAMFASELKPQRVPSGPAHLRRFVDLYPQVPHLAIGGVTPDTVATLVEAGGKGVAVSTAVCGADDPGRVVRALREGMGAGG